MTSWRLTLMMKMGSLPFRSAYFHVMAQVMMSRRSVLFRVPHLRPTRLYNLSIMLGGNFWSAYCISQDQNCYFLSFLSACWKTMLFLPFVPGNQDNSTWGGKGKFPCFKKERKKTLAHILLFSPCGLDLILLCFHNRFPRLLKPRISRILIDENFWKSLQFEFSWRWLQVS